MRLLLQNNILIDNTTNGANGLEACRVRIFADAAAAAAATPDAVGLEGAVASFTMDATFEGAGKLLHYRQKSLTTCLSLNYSMSCRRLRQRIYQPFVKPLPA